MKVAIHQPNYLPWLGYFSKIVNSDTFVLLDDVQYSKNSPAARNYIIGIDASKILLSVSVKKSKGAFQKYNELEIDYSIKWNIKHLNKINNSYSKTLYFDIYYSQLSSILNTQFENLAQLNIALISWMLKLIKCSTNILISSHLDLKVENGKNDRNLAICKLLGATEYLSGKGAMKYNDEAAFLRENIKLTYHHFSHPIYKQNQHEFQENLCFLDALFFLGEQELSNLFYSK